MSNFQKYISGEQRTYPSIDLTAVPLTVYDFGTLPVPGDGRWQANAGPATGVFDNTITPSASNVINTSGSYVFTTGGAPTAGTFAPPQLAYDTAGNSYGCTSPGSPGTWVALSAQSGTFRAVAQCLDAGANPLGDAVEIAAKLAALPTSGGTVALGRGRYSCPAGLTVTGKGVSIVGHGGLHTSDASVGLDAPSAIVVNSATATGLTISGSGAVLQDFAVINTSSTDPTAGAGIAFTAANQFSMRGVTVAGFYDNVTVANGWFYKITACNFFDPIRYGLFQQANAAYADLADMGVENCIFSFVRRSTDASAAFRWEGGGGMRWTGNKINGQGSPNQGGTLGVYAVGLDLVNNTASTVELNVLGGGISNNKTACIRTTGTSNGFGRILCTGVTFQSFGGTNTCTGLLLLGASGGDSQINNVIVDGCTFLGFGGSGIRAECMTGLTIGVNSWVNVKQMVTFSGGLDTTGINTRQLSLATQNFSTSAGVLPTDVSILRDKRSIATNGTAAGGDIVARYTLPMNLTTVGTWVTLFSFRISSGVGPARGAGIAQVDCAGYDNGVGAFHRRVRQGYIQDNGVLTIPTALEDVTVSSGTPRIAFRFDTTTTVGVVKVQAQATTGATQVSGKCAVEVRGWIGEFGIGDIANVP